MTLTHGDNIAAKFPWFAFRVYRFGSSAGLLTEESAVEAAAEP